MLTTVGVLKLALPFPLLGFDSDNGSEFLNYLNDLYTGEWRLFHNFSCPSVKLISKSRIASKTVKRYGKPKTPYQRVMESEHIEGPVKERLTDQLLTLNPSVLRRARETKIDAVFQACSRKPESTPLR